MKIREALQNIPAQFLGGHFASIRSVGWGEPPTFFPACTCGWQGRVIDWPLEKSMLIKDLKPFVEKYGEESILSKDTVFGTDDTALRECLEHLALNYDEIIKELKNELANLQANLLVDKHNWTAVDLRAIADLIETLAFISELKEFHKETPLAIRETPYDEAVYQEYRTLIKSGYTK